MVMGAKHWLVILTALVMLFGFGNLFIGCSEEDETPSGPVDVQYTADSKADCLGCHTNEEMLKATVEPEGEVISDLAPSEGHGFPVLSGDG